MSPSSIDGPRRFKAAGCRYARTSWTVPEGRGASIRSLSPRANDGGDSQTPRSRQDQASLSIAVSRAMKSGPSWSPYRSPDPASWMPCFPMSRGPAFRYLNGGGFQRHATSQGHPAWAVVPLSMPRGQSSPRSHTLQPRKPPESGIRSRWRSLSRERSGRNAPASGAHEYP